MYHNTLAELICLVETLFMAQLNRILHQAPFQALEARWRSLALLVAESADSEIILRCLDLSEREFQADLGRALEFDQTQVFEKIYSQAFDHPGGQPYGILVADYPSDSQNLAPAWRTLTQIATASFAPLIASAEPSLLGLNDFSEIQAHHHFPGEPHSKSDFLGSALPGFLLRPPHHYYFLAGFGEITEAAEQAQDYLWGRPAYAMALQILRNFREFGWFLQAEQPSQAIFSQTALCYFSTDPPETIPKLSLEVQLTQAQAQELQARGIWTWQKKQDCPLPSVLCASRIAHYLKVLLRDKIGRFLRAAEVEEILQAWLFSYCARHAEDHQRHRYPLQAANVKVRASHFLGTGYDCQVEIFLRAEQGHILPIKMRIQ